jgi:TonB family protein
MRRVLKLLLPFLAALACLAQEPVKPVVLRVGGNVQAANLVRKVNPEYPVAMKAQGLEATVTLSVLIDTQGIPISMSIEETNGPTEFTEAAIQAVRQWRYKPTLLNGQPVDVMTTVQVNFTLTK